MHADRETPTHAQRGTRAPGEPWGAYLVPEPDLVFLLALAQALLDTVQERR